MFSNYIILALIAFYTKDAKAGEISLFSASSISNEYKHEIQLLSTDITTEYSVLGTRINGVKTAVLSMINSANKDTNGAISMGKDLIAGLSKRTPALTEPAKTCVAVQLAYIKALPSNEVLQCNPATEFQASEKARAKLPSIKQSANGIISMCYKMYTDDNSMENCIEGLIITVDSQKTTTVNDVNNMLNNIQSTSINCVSTVQNEIEQTVRTIVDTAFACTN